MRSPERFRPTAAAELARTLCRLGIGQRPYRGTFSHVHPLRLGETVMVRASAYDASVSDPEFGFIADIDMWLRMACGSNGCLCTGTLITLRP